VKPLSGKPKKCPVCDNAFIPQRTMQRTCGWQCALKFVDMTSKKEWDKETIKRKRELLDNDPAHWKYKAQTAFNAYIRARDRGLPCVSCGVPDGQGKRNAGHFKPASINTALRFDEANCHGQCERCNTSLSGNLANYRPELVRRIGLPEVERLENDKSIKKWTIDDLKSIYNHYKTREQKHCISEHCRSSAE